MKPLAMIAAVARNRALGSAGKMPWHIPEDLRRFKALTLGHPVIMGRRTFASLGRPLRDRTNIVVSRTATTLDGCVVASSLAAALEHAKDDPLPFIIGGGEIYALALPLATKLYLTDVALNVEGADAWFPELDMAEWREVSPRTGTGPTRDLSRVGATTMKIYTKTGDDGTTGLFGGGRVTKDHVRVEAYGSVDELNAVLGLARAEGLPPDLEGILARIQYELFTVGAILATPSNAKAAQVVPVVEASWVTALENAIDALTLELPPLTHFILPSGARSGALLHLARTVCRRAERRVIALLNSGESAPAVVVYLNRLSDFLFVLARAVNQRARIPETPWVPKRPA